MALAAQAVQVAELELVELVELVLDPAGNFRPCRAMRTHGNLARLTDREMNFHWKDNTGFLHMECQSQDILLAHQQNRFQPITVSTGHLLEAKSWTRMNRCHRRQ